MPQRYHIVIQPRASNDLIAICEYIEQQSPQNAASVAQEILAAIDSLAIFPHRYKVHRSRRDLRLAVRSMPVRPFLVYYRVSESPPLVDVIAVVHGARQQS